MHTGDLGRRSADGYLFLVDRLKHMIVTGGENVYPAEVELVLMQHPEVFETAVLGLPDDKWGERVHAVVVLEPSGSATVDALRAFCREHLAGYKIPKTIQFIKALPRNAIGKVVKGDLLAGVEPPDDAP
jgi:acyl-CoA synthetase (AMP-forming)/AMP-acid ligase II